MRAGVVVRCDSSNAEEFLGNQVRELSALLGPLEILFLSYNQQVIAFKQEVLLGSGVEQKLERLWLMTRSFDSEIYVSTGIFPTDHLALATQLSLQVRHLTRTKEGVWDATMWRPLVWSELRPRAGW